MTEYCEEVGGAFSCEDIDAIPYNHWRKDFEWLVLIIEAPSDAAFVPVQALTAREACLVAINQYQLLKEFEEDDE